MGYTGTGYSCVYHCVNTNWHGALIIDIIILSFLLVMPVTQYITTVHNYTTGSGYSNPD